MKELNTMTPQELKLHIKECEEILKFKEKERFYQLVGDVASAAQKLFNEYPRTVLVADPYCEGCEQRVDLQIDIELLTYEDNYKDY